MRYDTKVELCRIVPGSYNPKTGNYNGDTETALPVYASVLDTATETVTLLYDDLKQASKTIHMQGHCGFEPDYVRIGKKKYRIDLHRVLRIKETFVISEMPE